MPEAAKGAVVLIVEDEALVRMSAADILQEAGFHVVESRDGMEALALLEIFPIGGKRRSSSRRG